MLKTENISITRTGSPVLNLPDVTINKGEHVLLLGPSGSGKTSLLSVLAGLLSPTSGKVILNEHDLYELNKKDIDQLRGKHFGLIFQTLHLLPTLTIRQNIEIAAKLQKTKVTKSQLDTLLTSLGLGNKANRKPDALSQGEQQRSAIARAIINKPSIILADEPTSALDDENAHIVAELLVKSAKESGAALVIATHDARILKYFTNIIHINPTKA